jgi:hypothetical protein
MQRDANGKPVLEQVFSQGHRYHDVLFYDYSEGKYYDRSQDRFLEIEELRSYGMPT